MKGDRSLTTADDEAAGHGSQAREQAFGLFQEQHAPVRCRGRQHMPVVIEVIETVDQPKPWIVHVSIRFPQRPAFTSSPEAAQLREKRRAVAVLRRETCVTHLVQQDAAFGAWSKTALNEDLTAMRLEETVASVGAG